MFIEYLFHAGIEDKLVATEGYGIVVTVKLQHSSKILKDKTTRTKAILA